MAYGQQQQASYAQQPMPEQLPASTQSYSPAADQSRNPGTYYPPQS